MFQDMHAYAESEQIENRANTSCVEIINGAETKPNLFPFRCRNFTDMGKGSEKTQEILKLHLKATNVLNSRRLK